MGRTSRSGWILGIVAGVGVTLVSDAALADACSALMTRNYTYTLTGGDGSESGTISFAGSGNVPGLHHNVEITQNGVTNWYDIQSKPCTDGPAGPIVYLYALSLGPGGICVDAPNEYEEWTFGPTTKSGTAYNITTAGWSGPATGGAIGLTPTVCTFKK